MESSVLLLSAKMLKMASESFSNNGCNDLSDEVSELIDDALMKQIRDWYGDEDYPSEPSQVADWMLMDFLKDKLKEGVEDEKNLSQ